MEAYVGGERRSAHTRDPVPGISSLPGSFLLPRGSPLPGSSFPKGVLFFWGVLLLSQGVLFPGEFSSHREFFFPREFPLTGKFSSLRELSSPGKMSSYKELSLCNGYILGNWGARRSIYYVHGCIKAHGHIPCMITTLENLVKQRPL